VQHFPGNVGGARDNGIRWKWGYVGKKRTEASKKGTQSRGVDSVSCEPPCESVMTWGGQKNTPVGGEKGYRGKRGVNQNKESKKKLTAGTEAWLEKQIEEMEGKGGRKKKS